MFEATVVRLAELCPSGLDAALEEAELAKRDAEGRIAAVVAVMSARSHYREDGHRSMRAFLKGTLNCSGTVANKLRRRADLMNNHPATGELLLAGRVGVEHIDLLAKAHAHRIAGERFDEFAPQLLDHAEHLEHDDFATVISHFVNMADPDGSFDDQQFQIDERTAWVAEANGAVDVHATGGSPLAAAEIKAIFDQAVQTEFMKDCATRRHEHGDQALDAPLPRTAQQRKFDALHQIFMTSVMAPADGKTPEPLVNILIDHITAGRVLHTHGLIESPDALGIGADQFEAGEADLLHRHCTINGTPVHPDVALKAMISGRIRRAVIDSDNVTINLGRTQRLFTANSRQAAQLLTVTCTRRGCDTPAAFCDTDHRTEWTANNGETNQHNAMIMCGTDDRWKHTNNIRTRRATNGRIHLIRADGTTIKPIGQTEPDWAEPHPTGPPTPTPTNTTTEPPIVNKPKPSTDTNDHIATPDTAGTTDSAAAAETGSIHTAPVGESNPFPAFGRPITCTDLTADQSGRAPHYAIYVTTLDELLAR